MGRTAEACKSQTFVSHHDRFLGRIVVDEDGCGIEGRRFQDLLFKRAVSSLQQRHPLDSPRRNQEPSAWVTALSVHH